MDVALRVVEDADLDALFDQMRDPESVRMAAFVSRDPDDRAAFDAHLARVRHAPSRTTARWSAASRPSCRTATPRSRTGSTGAWWGRGIASRALAQLLDLVRVRPLRVRAAGSLTVLRHAGFRVVGAERPYAKARGAEIEETVLRLDAQ